MTIENSSAQSSYAQGPTSTPLLEETIGASFERTVAAYGANEALVEVATGRRWTWNQLDDDVNAVARGLMGRGIAKGDRVGMWAPNCAEWTIVQFATAKIGAILVNVNPAYRTHEYAFVAGQSGMRLLLAVSNFKTSNYKSIIEQTREQVPVLDVVFVDTSDWDDLITAGRTTAPGALTARTAELSPDDPINIQYTSGTTGFPKGATLSHRNILNNGHFTTETIGLTHRDRLCIPVPFYHCFGMVMGNIGCVTHGATMVIPAPGFDPQTTLHTIEVERCTAVYGVPTMFIAMLAIAVSYDVTSLRTGIMAGSPCPVEVMKRCVSELHMEKVSICYGMTETSPVSTQTHTDDNLDRRTATIGTVHPHVEIKITDPSTGAIVDRGVAGEFCTRGYSVMLGYWNDPDKTAEAIDTEGWMHTGDLAVMRDDNYCQIVGRIKDMVIRGGENIYPREIEEFLYTHPDIEDVQIVGVPDTKYGEELCAWIRLRAGATLDSDGLREFATGKLAHYKIPRYMLAVDEFPMTVTGKIRKIDMREQSVLKLGLQPHSEKPTRGDGTYETE